MENPFPTPAPDFSDPLGLLRACHGRMLGHCDLFQRLREHVERCGFDEQATGALARAVRYFNEAAPLHHTDEEQDLFPLLALHRDPALERLAVELAEQHREIDRRWEELASLLKEPSDADREYLLATAEAFAEALRRHVEKENDQLLPAAVRILKPEQLTALGEAMAERRSSQSPTFPNDHR